VIRFKHTQSAIIAVAILVAIGGCSPKRSGEVLARVGDNVITSEDFKNEVRWRLDHHHPLPEKSALLEEMVARELSVQKAKALGLEKTFDVQRTYQEMLVGEVKDRELMPKVEAVTVSSQEIQEVYQREIAKYSKPSKTRLSFVYIKLDRKMNEEQKATAEAKIIEAEKAAHALTDFAHGFGAVAMDFSDDQASRYRGGDVGWFDESAPLFRWPKPVVEAGMALQQIGQMTPVIRASNGLFLVMKTDFRDKSITPLATVSASIRHQLIAEKKLQVEQAFAKELRASQRVQTDAVALSQLDYPTTTVAQVEEKMPPALPRSK
jgi:peptidyl-prolyl cis-trans isomerase C